MKKKGILLTILTSIILSSCACKKTAENQTASIYGEWLIETAMDKSTDGGEQQATITFDADGKINGCATVNRFFGEYTHKGDSLSFSAIGMTRKMGRTMDKEIAITQALAESSNIKINGNTAIIMGKDKKTVMVLKRK